MANEIYKNSWWGQLTNKCNWGLIYKEQVNETKEKDSENKGK